jgi:hypothetical protein
MFQIAEHVKREPTIESQQAAYTIQISAIWAVKPVLCAADPSPAACRELSALLEAVDNTGPSINAAKGNTAIFDLPLFAVARKHGYASTQFAKSLAAFTEQRCLCWAPTFLDYNRFDITWVEWIDRGTASWSERIFIGGLMRAARPFIPDDMAHYLSYREKLIHAHSLPWPESHAAHSAAVTELFNAADLESMLACWLNRPMNDLFLTRLGDARTALMGAVRVALAAAAYRADNGSYPGDMDDLRRDQWELPPATVAGGLLQYTLEIDGFRVRAVRRGAQHAHVIGRPSPVSEVEHPEDGAFDIVFSVTRDEGSEPD